MRFTKSKKRSSESRDRPTEPASLPENKSPKHGLMRFPGLVSRWRPKPSSNAKARYVSASSAPSAQSIVLPGQKLKKKKRPKKSLRRKKNNLCREKLSPSNAPKLARKANRLRDILPHATKSSRPKKSS